MINGYIYKCTNTINNKVYIGQTTNLKERIRTHIKDSKKENVKCVFHKALSKYGINNFKWEVIAECDALLLNDKEIQMIKKYKSYYLNIPQTGYNMTEDCNQGRGYKHTEEAKASLRLKRIGRKPALGRKLSNDEIDRLRISRIGVRRKIGRSSLCRNLDIFSFENVIIKEIFTGNMYDFSVKYNLDRSNITKLVKGKLKTYKHWFIKQNTW